MRKELARQVQKLAQVLDQDTEPAVSSLLRDAQYRDAIMAGLAERVESDGGSIDSAALAILAESTYHSERHTAFYVEQLRANQVFDLGWALDVAFFDAPTQCPIDCFRPLAEFALEIISQHDSIGLRDDAYDNGSIKKALDCVSLCIWDIELTLGIDVDREALFDTRPNVERERALEDPQNDSLRRILRFLLAHWNDIKSPYKVHCAMYALMSATGGWHDTPQERIAFARVCSACWKDYENRMGDCSA